MSVPEDHAPTTDPAPAAGPGPEAGAGPTPAEFSGRAFASSDADLVDSPFVTAEQADSARLTGGSGEPLIGRVIEPLPDALYRVELSDGHKVLAHPAGKARFQAVRILPGDRVEVELSAADPGRGRILRRLA